MLSGVELTFGNFTLSNPFSFDWHVEGIAAGTAISYLFGGAATLVVLIRGVRDLKLEGKHLPIDPRMCRRIVALGVPNFLEGMAMWGVNLFVLIFIGWIAKNEIDVADGQGLQGAHIIAVQWEALSFLPGFAMGTAAGALAGQYLGARNPHMASKAIVACIGVACAIMGLLGVLFMTQGELLTSIISTEPVHMKHVPNLLYICGTIQAAFAVAMVTRQGLRGAGDSMWPFLITSVSSYAVRLPLAWYLGVHLELGIEGIWLGLCGELVVRGALFLGRFMHGGWKRREI
jgi:Na+-driven multidrug efflux pump